MRGDWLPTQDAYSKPHQLSLDWSLDFDQGLRTEFKETKKKRDPTTRILLNPAMLGLE